MANEYEKILEFFNMSADEKSEHLGDVFEESIEFFDKFKHVMQFGTPEEKSKIIEQIKKLQTRLEDETKKVKEVTGLSDEELKAFAENKANFKDNDWDVIQKAKGKIDEQAKEITAITGTPEVSKKKSSGPKKRKKKWVKS